MNAFRACVIALATLGASGCAIPGETRASFWTEQGRIEGMINSTELTRGHYHPIRAGVVDTKVISEDEQGLITEHWIVDRGEHTVTYIVMMKPSAGGYDIAVKPPPAE